MTLSFDATAASLTADLHDSSFFDKNRHSMQAGGWRAHALARSRIVLDVVLDGLVTEPIQPFPHFLGERAAVRSINFKSRHGL
jgi:hypothetical protein